MNSELVMRLIALVQKNGDRVVLADPSTGRGVVVMDIDSYERMNAALDDLQSAPEPVVEELPTAPAPAAPVYAASQTTRTAAYAEESRVGFAQETQTTAAMPPVEPVRNEAPRRAAVPVAQPAAVSHSAHGRSGGRRRQTSGFESGPAIAELADLTQEQLLDKINRDIGEWKNAKDRRRTQELRSVTQKNAQPAVLPDVMEEEEKFYLEPIE